MPSLKRLILRNCSQLTVIRLSNPDFHHLDITRCYQIEEISVKSRAIDYLPLDDRFVKLRKLDLCLPPAVAIAAMRLSLFLLQPLNVFSSSASLASSGSGGIGGSELTISGPNAKALRTALASLQEFCATYNQWQPADKRKTFPLNTLTILRVCFVLLSH